MEPKPLRFHIQTLFSAVRAGDIDSVKLVLEQVSSNNEEASSITSLMAAQSDGGETALYIASENNLVEIFEFLSRFCDLQIAGTKSKLGLDALHIAAKRGHLDIVKVIMRLWPSLSTSCDGTNTTPLYSAADNGHLDIVNTILDADENSIRIVRKNGKTALHRVVRLGSIEIVKSLINKDPELVSVKDKKGQTALHMAVKGSNTEVVEVLLHADISILNWPDKRGNTALHIATRKCREQIVTLLLSYESIEVNAVNNQRETAMDLAEKLTYGDSALEIKEALAYAGAMSAKHIGQSDETMELTRTVSYIRHEVHTQLLQNAKTNRRVKGVRKELQKLHREAVNNTMNSVTLVSVLIASIAFMSIFNLPGQYIQQGPDAGAANAAHHTGFRVFCLLNATALFISLAVVVIQITLVAWETNAQKQVVSVVNKLMWMACLSICGAYVAIAFVVVGGEGSWMAVTATVIGGPIIIGTLVSMCYFVIRQHFRRFGGDDSQRRIRRGSGSKSFSLSIYSGLSDPDAYNSDHEKIYAL